MYHSYIWQAVLVSSLALATSCGSNAASEQPRCITSDSLFAEETLRAVRERNVDFFKAHGAPDSNFSEGEFEYNVNCVMYGNEECPGYLPAGMYSVNELVADFAFDVRFICPSNACFMTFVREGADEGALHDQSTYRVLFFATEVERTAGCWAFRGDLFLAGSGNPLAPEYG